MGSPRPRASRLQESSFSGCGLCPALQSSPSLFSALHRPVRYARVYGVPRPPTASAVLQSSRTLRSSSPSLISVLVPPNGNLSLFSPHTLCVPPGELTFSTSATLPFGRLQPILSSPPLFLLTIPGNYDAAASFPKRFFARFTPPPTTLDAPVFPSPKSRSVLLPLFLTSLSAVYCSQEASEC